MLYRLLVLSALIFSTSLNAQDYAKLYEEAFADYEAERFEDAIAKYKTCAENDHEKYWSLTSVANIYINNLGKVQEGIPYVLKLVDYAPDSVNNKYVLAQLYMVTEEYPKSLYVLKNIARYNRTSDLMFSTLDDYSEKSGDYEGPVNVMQIWVKRDSTVAEFHYFVEYYAIQYKKHLDHEVEVNRNFSNKVYKDIRIYQDVMQHAFEKAMELDPKEYKYVKALLDYYTEAERTHKIKELGPVLAKFDGDGNYIDLSKTEPSKIYAKAQEMFAIESYETAAEFYEICVTSKYKVNECRDELYGLYKWGTVEPSKAAAIRKKKSDALPSKESCLFYAKDYGYGGSKEDRQDIAKEIYLACVKRDADKAKAFYSLELITRQKQKDTAEAAIYSDMCFKEMGGKCPTVDDYIDDVLAAGNQTKAKEALEAMYKEQYGEDDFRRDYQLALTAYARATFDYTWVKTKLEEWQKAPAMKGKDGGCAMVAKSYGIAKMADMKKYGKSYDERLAAARPAFEDAVKWLEMAHKEQPEDRTWISNLINLTGVLGRDAEEAKWQKLYDAK